MSTITEQLADRARRRQAADADAKADMQAERSAAQLAAYNRDAAELLDALGVVFTAYTSERRQDVQVRTSVLGQTRQTFTHDYEVLTAGDELQLIRRSGGSWQVGVGCAGCGRVVGVGPLVTIDVGKRQARRNYTGVSPATAEQTAAAVETAIRSIEDGALAASTQEARCSGCTAGPCPTCGH